MKKLEDRIIKNIYVFETKKTALNITLKIIGVLFSGAVALFLTQILYDIFTEGQTFNVLEIFSDDIEIVRMYLGSILSVIFYETPLELVLLIVGMALLCLFIILTFVLNFGKMKHKLTAVWKYWRR